MLTSTFRYEKSMVHIYKVEKNKRCGFSWKQALQTKKRDDHLRRGGREKALMKGHNPEQWSDHPWDILGSML